MQREENAVVYKIQEYSLNYLWLSLLQNMQKSNVGNDAILIKYISLE